MKLATLLLLLACASATAAMPVAEVERHVNAIWHAEGGALAKYPYGIIAKRPLTALEA